MTRAIITYAAGAHEELLEIALPRFRKFAEKHGYELILGNKLVDMPPAWNKVALLLDTLKHGRTRESVTWLDCDLIITDIAEDFPLLQFGRSFSLVRHFSADSEVPNTGVWRLTPRAIPLLENMLELEVFRDHGWWEQAALMTLMGYVVPPQGSDFDETKCRCVRETRWTKECQFMRVEWNSHPCYRAPKPRIVHCSYPTMRQRIDVMRALIADSGYNYPSWEKPEKKA